MIKKLLLMIAFSVFVITAFSQNRNTALLVIDIQDFYFPGGDVPLVNPEDAAENAFTLINSFREKEFPVIFVRHNYEPGGSVNDIVLPLKDEKIITKNEINSFKGTDLDTYLKSLGIKDLVICGMQTHMCVEAAIRAAHDLGYICTLVEDACTTRDLKYGDITIQAADVHFSTLATLKSYAKIVKTRDLLNQD
jgi:nicotinamidase-related amidase